MSRETCVSMLVEQNIWATLQYIQIHTAFASTREAAQHSHHMIHSRRMLYSNWIRALFEGVFQGLSSLQSLWVVCCYRWLRVYCAYAGRFLEWLLVLNLAATWAGLPVHPKRTAISRTLLCTCMCWPLLLISMIHKKSHSLIELVLGQWVGQQPTWVLPINSSSCKSVVLLWSACMWLQETPGTLLTCLFVIACCIDSASWESNYVFSLHGEEDYYLIAKPCGQRT
jgi:hypothetical protein